MSAEPDFSTLWNRHASLMGAEPLEEPPNYCPYAQRFAQWAEELCVKSIQTPSLVALNQGKVLLIDKYFEWRSCVPKRHRSLAEGGHTCIFQVFATAYERLRLV